MTVKTKTKLAKRPYHQIKAEEVATFKALKALLGNGSATARQLYPDLIAPKDRAHRIAKKSETVDTASFIDDQLQQIGIDSVNRLGLLVHSPNEAIATKNVHYAIDHIRGQATKKSVSLSVKHNIQSVLE